jgi:hypothetical protein
MTDLERRLRAALRAATEPAPQGLFAAVMRRHRRHQVRVGASVLAAAIAVALAIPPAVSALRTGHIAGGPPTSQGSSPPAGREQHAVAAHGTVLNGCSGDANAGALGRNWRSGA